EDGTYFVVQSGKELAGCGGWSRRATLYGGDQTPGRSTAFLDPTKDPARVRAMYTHPHHVRKGVGRLILSLCEEAARAKGFTKMELMATLAGVIRCLCFAWSRSWEDRTFNNRLRAPCATCGRSVRGLCVHA